MPRPTPRLIGTLLLGAVLYAYGATSEVAWLFLLAYWCWTLAAAAFVYEWWNRRGLVATVELVAGEQGEESPAGWLPEAVLRAAPTTELLFEGDQATVRAALASLGGTRGPARLHGRVAGTEVAAGFGRVPAGGVAEERGLGAVGRGVVRAAEFEVEAGDPAGMFRDRGRLPDRELGLVLPRFAPLAARPRQRELEAAAAAPRAGAGSELFGVREYQPGDSPRRVHWRLSARLGELVVREFEPPGLRTLLLVLDPEPPTRADADAIARLAASEAWACQAAGGRVVAWAPGLEASAAEGSIWPILEWLARYPDLPAEGGGVPRGAAEAVAITTAPGAAALEALEEAARRGIAARAWQVGEGALATEVDVETVTA